MLKGEQNIQLVECYDLSSLDIVLCRGWKTFHQFDGRIITKGRLNGIVPLFLDIFNYSIHVFSQMVLSSVTGAGMEKVSIFIALARNGLGWLRFECIALVAQELLPFC